MLGLVYSVEAVEKYLRSQLEQIENLKGNKLVIGFPIRPNSKTYADGFGVKYLPVQTLYATWCSYKVRHKMEEIKYYIRLGKPLPKQILQGENLPSDTICIGVATEGTYVYVKVRSKTLGKKLPWLRLGFKTESVKEGEE